MSASAPILSAHPVADEVRQVILEHLAAVERELDVRVLFERASRAALDVFLRAAIEGLGTQERALRSASSAPLPCLKRKRPRPGAGRRGDPAGGAPGGERTRWRAST